MQLQGIFLTMGQGAQGNTMLTPIFMGAMIIVFYVFMIRPQAKKAKQQKTFISDLKKGDKIVTIAGIHGTINKVNEDGTLSLEVSPGSYLKIEKSTVSMEMSANLNNRLQKVKYNIDLVFHDKLIMATGGFDPV